MTKVHLLAGPNNAGKSNVLTVARRILPSLGNNQEFELVDVDRPLGAPDLTERQLKIALLVPLDDLVFEKLSENRPRFPPSKIRGLLTGPSFDFDDQRVWFEYVWDGGPRWVASPGQLEDITNRAAEIGDRPNWLSLLSGKLTGHQGGGEDAGRVTQQIASILKVKESIPPIASIGAFRQITPGPGSDVVEDEHNGPGLIERLAQLQNPGFGGTENRSRFERINHFLQSLLDDPEARIEIPYDRQTIQVFHAGQWLPLENYGTGLHEVIILAAAATVLSGHLVCIEEPEVHLHPTLQRKLLRYLDEQTDNQYLIATHSAHMLDFGRSSITAARLVDRHTELSPVLEPADVAEINLELGARASDLVQANSVIWVEGPSDRIYLLAWLAALAPELVEGIHFSILIYGGRLLRHLSADDGAVAEFIRLPRVNRNFGLVIDSDRTSTAQKLSETKTRVKREVGEAPGSSVWVTQGYTIENYVPPQLLQDAVSDVHPNATLDWDGDLYQNPLGEDRIQGRDGPVDKVAIAKRIAAQWKEAQEWPLDLKRKVNSLVKLIRTANED